MIEIINRQKKHRIRTKAFERLLAIHGYLHLLGFDHFAGIEEEERKAHGLYLA